MAAFDIFETATETTDAYVNARNGNLGAANRDAQLALLAATNEPLPIPAPVNSIGEIALNISARSLVNDLNENDLRAVVDDTVSIIGEGLILGGAFAQVAAPELEEVIAEFETVGRAISLASLTVNNIPAIVKNLPFLVEGLREAIQDAVNPPTQTTSNLQVGFPSQPTSTVNEPSVGPTPTTLPSATQPTSDDTVAVPSQPNLPSTGTTPPTMIAGSFGFQGDVTITSVTSNGTEVTNGQVLAAPQMSDLFLPVITQPDPDLPGFRVGTFVGGEIVVDPGQNINANTKLQFIFDPSDSHAPLPALDIGSFTLTTDDSTQHITGATLASSNIAGLSSGNVSFTDHSVTLNLAGTTYPVVEGNTSRTALVTVMFSH